METRETDQIDIGAGDDTCDVEEAEHGNDVDSEDRRGDGGEEECVEADRSSRGILENRKKGEDINTHPAPLQPDPSATKTS